jgi:hypothetical protein
MFLKEPALLVFSVFCTWLRLCTFPSVGWVNCEVLFIIIYYLCYFDCIGIYVFLLTCVFLFYFLVLFFRFLPACLTACIFVLCVCLVLPSVIYFV